MCDPIPVTERLPADGESVFVWCHEFGLGWECAIATCSISSLQPNNPSWYLDARIYPVQCPTHIAQQVYYWMPMPKLTDEQKRVAVELHNR